MVTRHCGAPQYDPVLYHDWPELIQELSEGGIRTLGYINPYLTNQSSRDPAHWTHNYFEEAVNNGYFIKKADGSPYLLESLTFLFGTIDLTNVEAREWYKVRAVPCVAAVMVRRMCACGRVTV
jgi:alpha-glucosidase